ncbi:haloacid dehalogenase [Thiopseudomonas alkaliphila]|uniref:acireductone synthase n=1 Tax=Thiopseudomonas alkaliphila TaxID=1697053 RepID=UPI00069EC4FF|nr:acireductone synthase [Thiopseudomonas alkaliphila]AKX46702.1 haloacid dehalogenase [Thiopseudomonas alkaliphila]AKX49806.1 haloacid dehalogenase [Thiopseudomonas alkaliphila]
MTIKAIVTDIEGTTSAVSFVFEVLFPYAKQHLPVFLQSHQQTVEVAQQIQAVRIEAKEPEADLARVIELLLEWIEQDVKSTALKALQGMVWQQGYLSGEIKGHVYPDAVQQLRAWHTQGYPLYVYSSGSVQAQKLIFGCSVAGDLTPLFSGYFDTTVGHKREVESYLAISQQIGVAPEQILFLSDVVQELDAATAAGMQVYGLAREGGVLGNYPTVDSFAQIQLS